MSRGYLLGTRTELLADLLFYFDHSASGFIVDISLSLLVSFSIVS